MSLMGAIVSSGNLRVRGIVHVGDGELRDRSRFDGAVRVDRALTVHGLFVAPSLKAGEFSLDDRRRDRRRGGRRSGDGAVPGTSHIGSIQAKSVILRVRAPNPVEMVLGRNLAVPIARIEAEMVDLEGVNVRFVRAREIVLGRGTHVTELEGHVVRRHASARVGPESRSPPPHGLTRSRGRCSASFIIPGDRRSRP